MYPIPYRTIAYILVPCVLCGVSWFYGYQAASAKYQGLAEKAYAEALEEAKKQGEQDKRIAEKATKQLTQKIGELNEIVSREIPSNPACVLEPDSERLRQLREISETTKIDGDSKSP